MSKGGGSAPQSTVTTQVEKLPVELVPFYKDLLGRGVYESLTGYETYPFRRLAEFDPYEAGAQEAYANMALAGTPQALADAQSGIREIAMGSPYERAVQGDAITQRLADTFQQAGETPDFYGPVGEQMVTDEVVEASPLDDNMEEVIAETMSARPQTSLEMQRYMNPFQQTFIDRQKRMAREEAQRQRRDLGLDAAQAGVLSGGFEAIARSEQERNLANQLQDIQAAGDMANFQQARRAYESDRQNRMDLADLGLRGFEGIGRDVDRRRTAALDMANLSGQRQAQEIDRLANLESAGQRRRALAQQGLDIGYQDFLRQQAFPREQLNLYSGLLRGVPVGPGQYSAVYGNQPTAGQQIAGSLVGLAGLGMGARGGFGNTGNWGGSG
tara:strand:- start:909 stop:2063 length:1155 start_codon:yes stop_codon:yes gene_type:complete